ncbi:uncharacterized protein BJ171DRAFT_535612 [Polychytrium aggregatum]|uniref:uncharacterized protein n=1 Tax=Polychytrium aggregatum TaxID=110093 RepID=UPI0022FF0853|nr:uncharacterized protein BJ171DRAFT_543462 [Polychytrium aggregatum]XP_052961915.1 uncharacterized protein BJ171DRAFT_535612 [Polychytrium aggregatum]KAI9190628.1 hypothetical protein BJ171DRAFT_543462 [Polychytrium aggregatum]KAI9192977.1 hypothetical protein BJ171DRAFT_535612 [Polychytrium aggregatum]
MFVLDIPAICDDLSQPATRLGCGLTKRLEKSGLLDPEVNRHLARFADPLWLKKCVLLETLRHFRMCETLFAKRMMHKCLSTFASESVIEKYEQDSYINTILLNSFQLTMEGMLIPHVADFQHRASSFLSSPGIQGLGDDYAARLACHVQAMDHQARTSLAAMLKGALRFAVKSYCAKRYDTNEEQRANEDVMLAMLDAAQRHHKFRVLIGEP